MYAKNKQAKFLYNDVARITDFAISNVCDSPPHTATSSQIVSQNTCRPRKPAGRHVDMSSRVRRKECQRSARSQLHTSESSVVFYAQGYIFRAQSSLSIVAIALPNQPKTRPVRQSSTQNQRSVLLKIAPSMCVFVYFLWALVCALCVTGVRTYSMGKVPVTWPFRIQHKTTLCDINNTNHT